MRLCALYHDVPVARRYRAENDRTNVANKVSCFPTCTRERERETGKHELVISKLRVYNGDH